MSIEDDATTSTESSPVPPGDPAFTTIVTADLFRSFIETITAVTDEGRLIVTDAGLQVVEIGPASVMGVDSSLHATGLESFNVEKPGNVRLSFATLDDVLSAAPGSLVELDYMDNQLCLTIGTADYWTSPLVIDDTDMEMDRLPGPYADHDWAEITVEADEIKNGLSLAELVDEQATLSFDPALDELGIQSRGDSDRSDIAIGPNDHLGASGESRAEALFSVEHLKEQLSPTDADTEMMIQFGNELPVQFNYTLDDYISVTSMTTPRIQT